MTARPDADSVNVHDTIWFELNATTSQTDITTGEMIDFSGAVNLSTTIQALRFVGGSISSPGGVDAENEFTYTLVSGTKLTNDARGVLLSIRPFEINNRYVFKFGIVPQRTGTYAIGISNSAAVRRTDDECSKAGFTIIFSNTNQHLYLYQQNRPGYIPSEYEVTHMYCFKVK